MERRSGTTRQKEHGPTGRGRDGQPGRARCGRGPRPRSPTSSTRSSTSTSATTSSRRWPTRTTGSRAAASTRSCCTCRRSAPFDLWDRDKRARRQAVRAARVHHGRRRAAACRRTCASCAAWSTRADLPLNVRAKSCRRARTSKAIRAGCTKRVLAHAGGPGREPARTSTPSSGRNSARAQGRRRRGPSPTRNASPSCCASRPPTTTREQACRSPTTSARMKEGQDEDLLRHRRHLRRRQEQPAPGGVPQEGHRGAAAGRPRRRMAAVATCTSSRASRCKPWPGRRRSGQAPGRGREERRRGGGRSVQAPARAAQGSAEGPGQGRARDLAPGRFARLPGGRRGRHERPSGAHAQAGRAGRAASQADPGGEPGARAGASRLSEGRTFDDWPTSCSTRRCWPKAASWRTRRRSSSASTPCSRRDGGGCGPISLARTAEPSRTASAQFVHATESSAATSTKTFRTTETQRETPGRASAWRSMRCDAPSATCAAVRSGGARAGRIP